jgi:hypothetical protein
VCIKSDLGGVLKSFGGALKIWRPFGVWRYKFSPLERSWRRFWSLGGVLKNLEAISSLEAHKGWIGALWRYFEALDVHVSTFQHCKS